MPLSSQLQTIKEAITNLKITFTPPNDEQALFERIQSTYVIRVINQLDEILKDKRLAIVDNFQSFLEKNWQLVKGTCLSYTASPDHAITQL